MRSATFSHSGGWDKYPLGTRAYASGGGHWERVESGWKWCTGDTFPTPGGDAFTVSVPAAEPADAGRDAFAQVCDALGIGPAARTASAALANIRNLQKFAGLLHAIEREFFMVPGEPDEDYPDHEPQDDCLLNSWGSTREEYVEQFRAAWNARPPSEAAAGLTKTAIEDIMAKYLGRHSRLYLYIQNDIRTALSTQQAVKP